MIMVKTVVLPAPLGPSRPTASPRRTAIETSATTVLLAEALGEAVGDQPAGLVDARCRRVLAHCGVNTPVTRPPLLPVKVEVLVSRSTTSSGLPTVPRRIDHHDVAGELQHLRRGIVDGLVAGGVLVRRLDAHVAGGDEALDVAGAALAIVDHHLGGPDGEVGAR